MSKRFSKSSILKTFDFYSDKSYNKNINNFWRKLK